MIFFAFIFLCIFRVVRFKTLTASLVQTEKKLKPLLSKVDGIADSLNHAKIAATVAEAHKTLAELNQVVTKINKGEGSLGLLIKTDTLHNNLNKTVKDLDKLFIDMQEHPSRYIFFDFDKYVAHLFYYIQWFL